MRIWQQQWNAAMWRNAAIIGAFCLTAAGAQAQVVIAPGVMEYGDEDRLSTGSYPEDPKQGATLLNLAPGTVTWSGAKYTHVFPFYAAANDFAGTDVVYVGSGQSGFNDGYSTSSDRVRGPQVFSLNYSALVPSGTTVTSLTLGVAVDDLQFLTLRNPFSAKINGTTDSVIGDTLNSRNLNGPSVQFFTVGIDPSKLVASNILTLSIDEGGNGGDGWAVDYLTVGVATTPIPASVPEPNALALLSAGSISLCGGMGLYRLRQRCRF